MLKYTLRVRLEPSGAHEAVEGGHDCGLDVALALDANVLLQRHEGDACLGEGVEDGDDLTQRPTEPVLQRGRRAVNFRLIAEQWDRLGQFYAAFPTGHATASAALQRLNRFQASNRFYAANRPIDLIVDSTELKILGRGEWNAHKHKASNKRRDWRKLHIGVDAKGFIGAAELTASSRDDASTLPDLLAPLEVPIRRFTADGAYDHRSVYDQLSAAGTENVVIVIPPRRSAVSAGPTDDPWAQRDTALERIRQVGRREWQKESGYRQQARVENSFFRYKSVLGGGLKARHGKAQRREVAIGCHILNRMAELGRPSSYALGR